jgi:glutamine synthetase
MSDTDKVMQMIKEHEVKYVDFRFTDPRGKWQHLAPTMYGRSPRISSMRG